MKYFEQKTKWLNNFVSLKGIKKTKMIRSYYVLEINDVDKMLNKITFKGYL